MEIEPIDNEILDIPTELSVSSTMDSKEVKEFIEYLVGDSLEPPASVNRMMNNLLNKLSAGLGLQMVSSSSRITEMQSFLAAAEQRLFDPSKIVDMSDSELAAQYKVAARVSNDLFEQQRKFIVQNQELFKVDSSPQEKLVSRLMSLSPDKLDAVVEQIDEIIDQTAGEVGEVESEIIDE